MKCDVSKYFDNIDHKILLNLLKKKINDERTLFLLEGIIESNPRGIPIGNLTSQLFANVYLNELDHFVKRELKENYFIRYMDDFLILNSDKQRLQADKEKIRIFLAEKLKLTLHPKKAEIFPIGRGLDFLGYVVRGQKRFLRKSTVKRFLKKRKRCLALLRKDKLTAEFIARMDSSWRGYAQFANSYRLMEKLGLNKKIKYLEQER